MAWDSIVNQQRVKDLLRAALKRGHLAHALLFTGPEGAGKEAMAIEVARVINCPNGSDDACGTCPDCVKMDSLQHPNLSLIFPLPVGKNEEAGDLPLAKLSPGEIETVQNEIRRKAKSPYHKISIPRANFIKVNSIREIRRTSSLAVFSPGKKVYVIFDAGKMNEEAGNALLKTLEEPLPDTVIILCAGTTDELLPTVVSRCQRLRFDLLPEQAIREALTGREHLTAERASLIAALSRGSYRQALELCDVDIDAYRSDIVELLRTFLLRPREDVYASIESISAAKDRQEVVRILSVMQAWFHESLALHAGEEGLLGIHDQALRKFTGVYSNIDYAAIARLLDEAISLVGKNAYIPLLLMTLAFNIRKFILTPTQNNS